MHSVSTIVVPSLGPVEEDDHDFLVVVAKFLAGIADVATGRRKDAAILLALARALSSHTDERTLRKVRREVPLMLGEQ
jgi:hypothetical protein